MTNETLSILASELAKAADGYDTLIDSMDAKQLNDIMGELITFLSSAENVVLNPKYKTFFATLGYMIMLHYSDRASIAANGIAIGFMLGFDRGTKHAGVKTEIDELKRMAGL